MIVRLLLVLLRRVVVEDEEEDDLEVIVLTPTRLLHPDTEPLPPHRASILPYIARVSIYDLCSIIRSKEHATGIKSRPIS